MVSSRLANRHACSLQQFSRAFSSSSSLLARAATPKPIPPPNSFHVYDAALNYIRQDQVNKTRELKKLKEQIESGQGGHRLSEQAEYLEIESQVNDPAVLWAFRNGRADLSKPVYRHLAELKWRKEGRLSMLMQRITMMNVVPDVIQTFIPKLDLSLRVRDDPNALVEVGTYLEPIDTLEAPLLRVTPFHSDTRLYTLVLLDPDVPDPASQSFTTFCHQIIRNIPLSPTRRNISTRSTASEQEVLPYLPPHPQQGTKYHRYTYLLLEQPNDGKTELRRTAIPSVMREGFDARQFMTELDLNPAGIFFWREVWEQEAVARVYRDILRREEPRYGLPPKSKRNTPPRMF